MLRTSLLIFNNINKWYFLCQTASFSLSSFFSLTFSSFSTILFNAFPILFWIQCITQAKTRVKYDSQQGTGSTLRGNVRWTLSRIVRTSALPPPNILRGISRHTSRVDNNCTFQKIYAGVWSLPIVFGMLTFPALLKTKQLFCFKMYRLWFLSVQSPPPPPPAAAGMCGIEQSVLLYRF